MGEKKKKQLLEELFEVQKMLEERTEIQGQMIRKFQTIIANEGLVSQIVDFFPYPMAIFTAQYTVVMVNKAFAVETKIGLENLERGPVRVLPHKIDEGQLFAAVKEVFAGDTFFIEDLKNPFSMFSGIIRYIAPQPVRFNKAVVFPVATDDAKITHGVIVFMP
jgi:hypothetical protein